MVVQRAGSGVKASRADGMPDDGDRSAGEIRMPADVGLCSISGMVSKFAGVFSTDYSAEGL